MTFIMLAEAWSAMAANRLRTFLTMLGMVIDGRYLDVFYRCWNASQSQRVDCLNGE